MPCAQHAMSAGGVSPVGVLPAAWPVVAAAAAAAAAALLLLATAASLPQRFAAACATTPPFACEGLLGDSGERS